eukprot:3642597-Pyramimonas_sp.AAC.1
MPHVARARLQVRGAAALWPQAVELQRGSAEGCAHPPRAILSGSNGASVYSHCRMRSARISLRGKTPEGTALAEAKKRAKQAKIETKSKLKGE